MRVVNIMFGRSGGGIEQAMLDYCRALAAHGHEAITVTPPNAWVNARLPQNVTSYVLKNWGEWDRFAAWRLRRIIQECNPDVIIAHANRALSLAVKAVKGRVPIIAVAQNYSIRRYVQADAVFSITQDIAKKAVALGIPANKVFHIPNMVPDMPELTDRPKSTPPVVGAMGRFVAKKGFDIYLRALKILKDQGVAFKALLGGNGEEEAALKSLINELGLTSHVECTGWVDDRLAFYNRLDIFCLPSLHEPFGIVLLEAFAHRVPVVSTDTEGPLEILQDGNNALMAEKGDPVTLATQISKLLSNETLRQSIAASGHKTAHDYTHQVVGTRIDIALKTILISPNKRAA